MVLNPLMDYGKKFLPESLGTIGDLIQAVNE